MSNKTGKKGGTSSLIKNKQANRENEPQNDQKPSTTNVASKALNKYGVVSSTTGKNAKVPDAKSHKQATAGRKKDSRDVESIALSRPRRSKAPQNLKEADDEKMPLHKKRKMKSSTQK